MLIALTGILLFNLILFLLSNIFYQNRRVRLVRNLGFLIALLLGTAIGVVDYLTKSPTYASELGFAWFTYADIHFRLSLTINSAIAYLIGFYSLLHLVILFINHEVFKTRASYNYLFSAYLIVTGLLLSNDLMTFIFFWCWSVILLMLLVRQDQSSFNYPPLLGIFILLFLSLLIINISRQTFIPDVKILSQCPAESVIVFGSLVTIIVLIQGCQFPFPVWLPVGNSAQQGLATMFIYISNVILSLGVLVWKFFQVLLPIHRLILGIGGFLTILLAFIRIHTKGSDFKTSLIYFLTGELGLALIALLADNSPFVVQLLAGFQVTISILLVRQLWAKPVDTDRKSRFFTDSVDFITLALIAGVPLSIHHVIRLTLLKKFLSARPLAVNQYFGIILSILGTLAIIGMMTRIIIQIRQNRFNVQFISNEGLSKERSLIALMLTWGMSLWFFYPLEPASGLAPVSRSILLSPSIHPTISSEQVALLNLILAGFWVISLAGFLFFTNKITFPPLLKWSRTGLYTVCLGQVPSRLVILIQSVGSILRRWQTRFGGLMSKWLALITTAIKKTFAERHSYSFNLRKQIKHLLRHRLWLLGVGIVLLVAGIISLVLYLFLRV